MQGGKRKLKKEIKTKDKHKRIFWSSVLKKLFKKGILNFFQFCKKIAKKRVQIASMHNTFALI
jgi:hypothetical protein